jgi:hypothetical protein
MGELSIVQWILIGVGILVILPNVLDFFKGVSLPSFGKSNSKVKLSTTVSQWEFLYNSCKELCLMDACEKLDEVFPLLVERDQKCIDKEKEGEIEILNN